MNFELVVTQAFGSNSKGDVITDDDAMKAALDSNSHCVVRRAKAAPDPQTTPPAPAPAPKP